MTINALLLAAALAVPQQVMSPAQQKANDAFAAQKWTEAAAAYEALAKEMPNAPQPQFRLAASLVSLGKYEDAIPHFQQAEKLGSPAIQVALRLAHAYAALGRSDDAFAQLKRATDAGLGVLPPPLDTDPNLAKLKPDTRYKTFETAMDRNVRPCEYDPHFRELDYWIGEWEVRGVNAPPQAPPSTSVIAKVHSGCVILETYNAPGYAGQSFNIYDRSKGQWHQTWVDTTGGLHEYWGGPKDGSIIYEGSIPPAPGQKERSQTRMSLLKIGPDTVRQLGETSADGGKTWQVAYDLTYTRKK
jgi:tetratricopeptide (TPR) repeat protein